MSIAAVLKEAGHEVKILDRDVESTSFVGLVKTFDPEIIGFSTYTGYMLRDAIEISQKAKKTLQCQNYMGRCTSFIVGQRVFAGGLYRHNNTGRRRICYA
ncbi:MAG: cobalamin B12-binding domain-containing protein [Chloroflexia bacterium]|nr:cobalamin B12-binding domain-containing protein [Chloroflexia bacterium]